MKRIKFLILIIGLLMQNLAFAVVLYTPKGSSVTATTPSEVYTDQVTRDDIKAYWLNIYPNATVIGEPSSTYNCHSYAWNMTEGGPTAWLIASPDLHKYWDDGSYIQTTIAEAEKIYYSNGDHSAIVSPVGAGLYDSKWGAGPLMRHAPSYCPYVSSSGMKYYKKNLFISGATIIGGTTTATYTLPYLPYNTNVIWGTPSTVTATSNNLSLTLTPTSSSFVGDVDISAYFYDIVSGSLKYRCYYYVGVGGAHQHNVSLRVVRSSDGVEVYPSSVGLCPNTYYYAYISGTAGATLTWNPTHATLLDSSNTYMYFKTDSQGWSILNVYGVLSQYGVSKQLAGVTLYGGSSCD